MGKIRVGIVNYLNTKPLIYGLQRPPISDLIQIKGDYPARVAEMLINNEVDVGLVPIAVLPQLTNYHIVGNYCIGTEGEIASVALFSEVPMHEIETIYLDYQSRTSVELLKYLVREYWGISPVYIQAKDEHYREAIADTSAGLVIGDRAFEQRKISTFIYDLGSEWKKITGLPFVFAAWVSKQKMTDEFVEIFDKANGLGLKNLDEIIKDNPFTLFSLEKYYNLHLSYKLDEQKRKGMELFLNFVKNNS